MNPEDTKELIREMKDVFATKEDMATLATKDDLQKFATKEDVAKLATKKDLSAVRKDVKDIRSDIKVLRTDHANLEGKVDDQGEKLNKVLTVVSSLPSRSDLEEILERSSSYAVLKSEHNRMKKVIGEQHHVEI